MIYESEWDGFAAQAQSGISEALYAAGVDCSVHAHGEPAVGGDSFSEPDDFPQRPPNFVQTRHASTRR